MSNAFVLGLVVANETEKRNVLESLLVVENENFDHAALRTPQTGHDGDWLLHDGGGFLDDAAPHFPIWLVLYVDGCDFDLDTLHPTRHEKS